MKRKIVSLFLATSLCAAMLAGCGAPSAAQAPDSATSVPADSAADTSADQNAADSSDASGDAASGDTADSVDDLGLNADQKDATEYTIQANNEVYAMLDFDDKAEFENATRGLIASPDTLDIKNADGKITWSQTAYGFVEGDAPDTANPSLWRNTQLNHFYGLFEVTDGIYQVRGYDMSNITFIAGDTGWIVMDPLMTMECAQAALELVNENLGERPVKAVIYSHSHVDHYGGVEGIISQDKAEEDGVLIIAPEHFEEHAVSENIYAGTAMGRRSCYQYGSFLEKGEKDALCIGIGMGGSTGTTSYISPNTDICETGQTLTVDGVEMVFQLTPGTEAPAEMNTWFPAKKALWMAENCTGTLHNLYTLRGAAVRDGNAWAEYLMEALSLYGDEVEVVFQAHNWPHWDNETIREYVTNTAAVYKFINDQTLSYLNQGYTDTEIAGMIQLPKELEKVWYTRQYYGTVAHNSKAVYEKYMGWYDANPIHLAELSPTETARKTVEYMGDPDEILKMAKADYDKGEYQWVAQITNILVYNDPTNMNARYLCADALEQLGYQAESGTWRNSYLCAAQELRFGTNTDPDTRVTTGSGLGAKMTAKMSLEYMGICMDTTKVPDLTFTAVVKLPEESYTVSVKNGIILYQTGIQTDSPDVTWITNEAGLLCIAHNDAEKVEELVVQEGDTSYLEKMMAAMIDFDEYSFFNIIEP